MMLSESEVRDKTSYRVLRVCGMLLYASITWLSSTHIGLANPVVFWLSDPVDPDDTVLITGSDLSAVESVSLTREPDAADLSGEHLPGAIFASIVQKDQRSLKFALPLELSSGVYEYTLFTDSGSISGVINAPVVYWMQGDSGTAASRGGWIRVFGRNIFRAAGGCLELSQEGGQVVRLRASSADLWDAGFPIPEDLSSGRYRVRIWNGQGDNTAWRDAGSIEITEREREPSVVVNVKEFGALGDGEHDDWAAITTALLEVARRGGGVVKLARGQYLITKTLSVPDGVAVIGEGVELVSLLWRDATLLPVLIEGGSRFKIADLEIAASRHNDIIRGGFDLTSGLPDGTDVTVQRVRIRASAYLGHLSPDEAAARTNVMESATRGGVASLRLAGRNLTVDGCDIYGSARAFVLVQPINARVARNIFHNGRRGWYSISNAAGVIFEDNVVVGSDLSSSGGGINTLGSYTSYSENVLFRNNKFENIFGWDREALTTDGPGGFYNGPAWFRNTKTLELQQQWIETADRRNWMGAGLFVLSGPAAGEYARVESRDGSTVHLDRDLPVVPSETDILSIVPTQLHYLIIGNHFSDVGAAIQIFGTGLDHVIAWNVAERTSGIINHALDYSGVQPTWHNQFISNEIRSGDLFGPAVLSMWGAKTGGPNETFNYGSIVRNNTLTGNAKIVLRGESRMYPGLSTAIVEHNHVELQEQGIYLDEGVTNVLLRGNDHRKRLIP